MLCMKKKKVSGKHASPRKTVQMPEDWLKVAQELASEVPTPVMWLLVSLIHKAAEERKKTNLPPLPWQIQKT